MESEISDEVGRVGAASQGRDHGRLVNNAFIRNYGIYGITYIEISRFIFL